MLSRNQKSQSPGEMNLRVWRLSKRKGMVKHTHTQTLKLRFLLKTPGKFCLVSLEYLRNKSTVKTTETKMPCSWDCMS